MRTSLVLLSLCLSLDVRADSFATTFSEHSRLANRYIVEVGEVEKLDPPTGTRWSGDVLRLNSRCLRSIGYLGYWGHGKKAALLLVDRASTTELAILESSLGSISVEIKPVIVIGCPAQVFSPDPQKSLEELNKLKIETQQLIEQLNKRQNRKTQP